MAKTAARTMMTPVGYEIVIDKDETGETIYSYRFGDQQSRDWWRSRRDCVDQMWTDVRNRATQIATGGVKLPENIQNTLAYAFGWTDAKEHVNRSVAVVMARHGYVFDPKLTAVETVERLLEMLTPKS